MNNSTAATLARSQCAILMIGLLCVGCGGPMTETVTDTVSKDFETAATTAATSTIVAETFSGSIDITPSTDGKTHVEVRKKGFGKSSDEARANMNGITLKLVQDGTAVRVVASGPLTLIPPLYGSADITLKIPPGATVRLINRNGDIGATGSYAALHCETSNGSIQYRGTLGIGEQRFITRNGSVSLALPPAAAFELNAKLINAKTASEFGMKRAGSTSSNTTHAIVGDLPAPATLIDVAVTNGTLSIAKSTSL